METQGIAVNIRDEQENMFWFEWNFFLDSSKLIIQLKKEELDNQFFVPKSTYEYSSTYS